MRRPDLSHLHGRNVLLTGAAGGIGRATARLAARDGALLFLTDLDGPKLAALASELRAEGGRVVHAESADLTDRDAVDALARHVHSAAEGPMDLVINAAGAATWGSVSELTPDDWRGMVDVNLMGPVHVISAFVPPMVAARRGGHLVNVASAAGLLGLPWHAAYTAGKSGLCGVSEVLRFDLGRHGIGVSLVCPGAVDTPLVDTVRVRGIDEDSSSFRRLRAGFRRTAAAPEEVAARILDAVARNTYLVHTSGAVRALHLLQRWAPPLYAAAMHALNRAFHRLLAPARHERPPRTGDQSPAAKR
ncbi:SDR family oxidoreductase [Streptomyces sp. NA04227]|uniref:SDR family oxidoreductase n=1 Tax=Streptomyces sp. NA04227 TaxID=2742136 RepID=UPI001590B98C|nr:SDR family oxidoreductase [Streptomyces sp. NA04227]QKW09882.1 SDR family oxidoreductase [Streptomyces sp. NA04227]